MFCRHCGAELPDDAQFCEKCGKSLEPAGAGTPAVQEPPATPAGDQGGLIGLDLSNLLNPAKKPIFYPVSEEGIDFTKDEVIYLCKLGVTFWKPLKYTHASLYRETAQPVIFLLNNEVVKILGANFSTFKQVRMGHRTEVGTVERELTFFWFLDLTFPISQISGIKNVFQTQAGTRVRLEKKDFRGVEIKSKGDCNADIFIEFAGEAEFIRKEDKRKELLTNQKAELVLFPLRSAQQVDFKNYFGALGNLGLIDDGSEERITDFYENKFKVLSKLLKRFTKDSQETTITPSLTVKFVMLQSNLGERPGFKDGSWVKEAFE